jgi:hypothetical protein
MEAQMDQKDCCASLEHRHRSKFKAPTNNASSFLLADAPAKRKQGGYKKALTLPTPALLITA